MSCHAQRKPQLPSQPRRASGSCGMSCPVCLALEGLSCPVMYCSVCPADRDALFCAMCSFPKCITYISQVYSPSVNVRKPWKYVHFAIRSA